MMSGLGELAEEVVWAFATEIVVVVIAGWPRRIAVRSNVHAAAARRPS